VLYSYFNWSAITGLEVTASPHLQLLTVETLNRTAVRLGLAGEPQSRHENITVEVSLDQKTWKRQGAQGLVVQELEPGRTYYIRVKSGSMVSNAVEVSLPTSESQHTDRGNACRCHKTSLGTRTQDEDLRKITPNKRKTLNAVNGKGNQELGTKWTA
jgi:hypothetical protein